MIRNLNFILVLITIVLLALIGLVFVYGTGYSWTTSLSLPQWTETILYQRYLSSMNVAMLPLVLALVVALGICIPKRLFSGWTLLGVGGALVAVTLVMTAIFGYRTGLSFLLLVALGIQLMVLALAVAGSERLHFERTGFFLQVGSALLHLGLVLFLFDFVLLQGNAYHLPIFWVSAIFIAVGMTLSFYSRELAGLARRN